MATAREALSTWASATGRCGGKMASYRRNHLCRTRFRIPIDLAGPERAEPPGPRPHSQNRIRSQSHQQPGARGIMRYALPDATAMGGLALTAEDLNQQYTTICSSA